MVGGLRGELSSVDGYMNIALEKTVEYVGGQVRNKYGDVFIRGNNGEFGPRMKGVGERRGGWANVGEGVDSVVYFSGCNLMGGCGRSGVG